MRGNTAFPLIWSGPELVTLGVAAGTGVGELGVGEGAVVAPGGSAGVSTKGDPPGPADAASAGGGETDAAVEPGHESVRKTPSSSDVKPVRHRDTTRNR